MGNSIALSKKYVPMLDEVYKAASKSAILRSDQTLAKGGANANEIVIPKISMDGLADYSRNSGYVKGDVTFTWETVTFNYDRGRMFTVDSMDNEETLELAFGKLGSEFIRTKVAPEGDAFTFAQLAGTTGISTVAAAVLSDGAAVLTAILAATTKMDEDEVPAEDRYLFITPTLLNSVKALDTTKSREALDGFASLVTVPQSRFYTAIDMYDGTTSGEEAGFYVKATGAADINFMIIHKPAVLMFDKHVANNVIRPEDNQSGDGYIQKYRKYGLVDVFENKVAGIYLHKKTS